MAWHDSNGASISYNRDYNHYKRSKDMLNTLDNYVKSIAIKDGWGWDKDTLSSIIKSL